MNVTCFMIELTGTYSVYARRYVSGSSCPAAGHDADDPDRRAGIHSAMILQSIQDGEVPSSGTPTTEQRAELFWPQTCDHCSYPFPFSGEDTWQVLHRARYARVPVPVSGKDSGAPFDLEDAPVGSMYRAEWYERTTSMRGPDGLSLVVVLPNGAGPWCIDGLSSDGKGWTRTGTPPLLTVSPSIGRQHTDGTPGWRYHGWLKNGVLSDA